MKILNQLSTSIIMAFVYMCQYANVLYGLIWLLNGQN